MRKSVFAIFAVTLCFSLFSLVTQGYTLVGMQSTGEVQRITRDDLKALLNNPDTTINTTIIDVRLEGDWQQSNRKIRGAVHEDPMQDEASWAGKYPKDKNIVLY